MQSRLSYIKSKLRDNAELTLGLLSIFCFYAIVIFSLMNNMTFFSLFVETDVYWANLLWKAVLLGISIFTLIAFFKEVFLVNAAILSHMGLLYYYGLFSLLSFNTINLFRVSIFFMWWLSLIISLSYFRLASQRGKISKQYYIFLGLFFPQLIAYLIFD